MARFLKSTQDTIGLSPEAMHFFGEQKVEHTRIRCMAYTNDSLEEVEIKQVEELQTYTASEAMLWINVDGLHNLEKIETIANMLSIEPMAVANLLDTHSRPRLTDYDSCLFVSTRMLSYNEDENQIAAENLVLILKDNLLVTFQERVGDVFEPVRERLRKSRKRIRTAGSDYLAFALLDVVIDNYLHVISRLGEYIEGIDNLLVEGSSTNCLEDINGYKVEINYVKKAVRPCREIVMGLLKSDSELLDELLEVHLQELRNNIELANETVDHYREMLSDQLNIFHTTVSYRLNDILKFLTIFSVIFIPITFIAGVYGTNFDYIPELHYKYSYPLMWVLIIIVVIVMLTFFKRKKWL